MYCCKIQSVQLKCWSCVDRSMISRTNCSAEPFGKRKRKQAVCTGCSKNPFKIASFIQQIYTFQNWQFRLFLSAPRPTRRPSSYDPLRCHLRCPCPARRQRRASATKAVPAVSADTRGPPLLSPWRAHTDWRKISANDQSLRRRRLRHSATAHLTTNSRRADPGICERGAGPSRSLPPLLSFL